MLTQSMHGGESFCPKLSLYTQPDLGVEAVGEGADAVAAIVRRVWLLLSSDVPGLPGFSSFPDLHVKVSTF